MSVALFIMTIAFQQINTVTIGLVVSAPLNTAKKFGGQIVFWILNLFLSGARSLWVICSKISTHKSFTYSINLPLYPRHNLPWVNSVMGHKSLYLFAMGKVASPCVWADGSHGEADDHCADVQSLRITQVGGKLDRRESTGHMRSCNTNQTWPFCKCFWPWQVCMGSTLQICDFHKQKF